MILSGTLTECQLVRIDVRMDKLIVLVWVLTVCKIIREDKLSLARSPKYEIYLEITEQQHEISNNVACATSKGSDQPAQMRSLVRAFARRLNIVRILSYRLNIIWSFYVQSKVAQARPSLHLSKCHIVGNHMWLNYVIITDKDGSSFFVNQLFTHIFHLQDLHFPPPKDPH